MPKTTSAISKTPPLRSNSPTPARSGLCLIRPLRFISPTMEAMAMGMVTRPPHTTPTTPSTARLTTARIGAAAFSLARFTTPTHIPIIRIRTTITATPATTITIITTLPGTTVTTTGAETMARSPGTAQTAVTVTDMPVLRAGSPRVLTWAAPISRLIAA